MKKIFKKNQVIITALAIMIAVAGYLNFTSDKQVLNTSVENMESEGASGNADDAAISVAVEDTLEGAEVAQSDESVDAAEVTEPVDAENVAVDETDVDVAEASVDENGEPIDAEKVGEAVLTSGAVTLSEAKLNREQTRSKAKEMLLEIINNENLSEDSKKDAINKMLTMTETMEKETAAETQLAAKGFADSIVSISEDSVDVTVNAASLESAQRTQIEDIIMRKTGCDLNKIVITTVQN